MEREDGLVEGHALLLPFDTDSRDFARGFELGRLWALLRTSTDPIDGELVRIESAEMVIRLAEACGRTVGAEELDDSWLAVTFGAAEEAFEAEGL